MKTKNKYTLPIEPKDVDEQRKDSPAHIISYGMNDEKYDERKAVDFLCAVGTKILAAHDGRIIKVVNNLNKKWTKRTIPPKEVMTPTEQYGNFVVIAHENEEFSLYAHFDKGSIIVCEGQDVKKGQVLGLSGNTGWSIKPHLHFQVHKNEGKGYTALEVKWGR